ncbi:hypothetical protein [Metamycoplasma canadense]|uniref:hypothetical protein n=1 Tax=Metamycoplasma canadense TaxID=29554 RepID=UPI0005EF1178|nr:hypothetical protein [Metamycoplasma canadense]
MFLLWSIKNNTKNKIPEVIIIKINITANAVQTTRKAPKNGQAIKNNNIGNKPDNKQQLINVKFFLLFLANVKDDKVIEAVEAPNPNINKIIYNQIIILFYNFFLIN